MNTNKKLLCTACAALVLTGIIVSELKMCPECKELPVHAPETQVIGQTGISDTFSNVSASASVSSLFTVTGPTGPSQFEV